MTKKIKTKRIISLILSAVLLLSGGFIPNDNTIIYAKAAEGAVIVSSAEELPTSIEAGTTYELAANITLGEGQQISSVAGVLDGKGYTITLADKPLANEVTGTIQNVSVTSAGEITGEMFGDTFGSIAVKLYGGSIINCSSTATLKDNFNDAGSLVGDSVGGIIRNSYFGGTMTGMMFGGLIGKSVSTSSTITECYYTCGENPVSYGMSYNKDEGRFAKKSYDEMVTSDFVSLLNSNITDTGYVWATDGASLPYLVPSGGENPGPGPSPEPEAVDFSRLQAKVDEVKALNKDDYTVETWDAVQEALNNAETIITEGTLDQKAVNSALDTLTGAVSALKKPLPTKAVALPADEIISIASVNDLSGIGTGEGKYYRLENDITIRPDDWYFTFDAFNGVFDGNGHTVTFENTSAGLFMDIGVSGVVQNTQFAGTLDNAAAVAGTNYGAIINCISTVTGNTATGIVKRVCGGVVSNCVSYGKAGKGNLISEYGTDNYETEEISKNVGKVYNSYWIKSSNEVAIPGEDLLNGSSSKTEGELKSKEIVNALNENAGEYGISWGQNGNTGYPYFGADEEYNPGISELPENKYEVSFGKTKKDAKPIENQLLVVSRNDLVSVSDSVIGQFFIEGVDSKDIEWSVYDVTDEAIDINKQTGTDNNGKLHIFKDGEGIVKGNVKGEDAIWVKVVVSTKPIKDLKLFINDEDVTNGSYTVEGSSWATIKVKAIHEGETEYSDVYGGVFEFKYDDNKMVHNEGTGTFKFNSPGTSKVTVISKEDRSVKAEIKLTSTFVPIESIEPDLSEVNYIHSRASMMDGRQFDAIETNGVIILPENASNKTGFNVTSSNEEVAKFSATLPLGYLPFKQGKTTLKASIVDTNPLTNESRTVTGTREVEFIYKNPLTKINVTYDKISVKTNEKAPLNLTFEGELLDEGYSVTEPLLNWTYSKEGIVDITREKLHEQNRDENAPDGERGYWIATTNYEVEGLKEGVVTAVGTPADDTNNVEPVVLTIKVSKGENVETDTTKLAEIGRNTAASSILASHKDVGYSYGDEWDVFTLVRSGVELSSKEIEAYYKSVEDTVKSWDENTKPTDIERVILALAVLDKDVTNVSGTDLSQMVLSSDKLNDGSNEFAFALISLKSAGIEIPKEKENELIENLISFQNPDGGYALFENGASGVDTTAMALQALALYRDKDIAVEVNDAKSLLNIAENISEAEIDNSISRGLDYLKANLNVSFDAGNSEADSQVILALTSLGLDPETEAGFSNGSKNVITALMSYHLEGRGFAHSKNKLEPNKMATVQAYQALEAYRRFKQSEPSYWEVQEQDFEPAPKPEYVPTPDQKPIPEPKPESTPDPNPTKEPEKKPSKKPSGKTVSKNEDLKKESKSNKNDVTVNKLEKTKGYTITVLDEDKETIDKLKLEIIKGSKFEDSISKLAKDPYLFHFNTDKDFGASVMVEMDVDLKDGEYVLLHYSVEEEKLEVVQKLEVKDKKTKFVVSKGGDYCITTKASTKSLKDEENDSRAMTLYLPIMIALAIGTAVPTTIIISKKTRKHKDSDEE